MPKPYAGFWKRFFAYILDYVVLAIGLFLVGILAAGLGVDLEDSEIVDTWAGLLAIAMFWLYYAIMESSPTQATLGKMTLGVKVTDLYGGRISFARASGRFLGKFISSFLLCIGYIMAAFTQKKQALHDIMSGCLVIDKNANLDDFMFS